MTVETVVAAETTEQMECNVNSYLKNLKETKVPVAGFGASDCRKNCKSHLLYFPDAVKADCLVQKIVRCFESTSGILSVVIVD